MSKKRRTQEQRRRDTQDAVLDAVIGLLLERGYAKLTAVEVAARAGVSRGAQSHYFRTKPDLVLAAAERAMAAAIETARQMADEALRSDDVLRGFIEQSRRFFLDPSYIAVIEIVLVARTDPSLAGSISDLTVATRAQLDDIWSCVFRKSGVSDDTGSMLFNMTHHLMRGMAMSTLWRSEPAPIQEIISRWTVIAEGIYCADRIRRGPDAQSADQQRAPGVRSTVPTTSGRFGSS